jgi:predicted kinase
VSDAKRKKLIIVDGQPGTGKTMFSSQLSKTLNIPLISKDEIKEQLFDSVGVKDREWSKTLGAASFDLMWMFAAKQMKVTSVLMLETYFNAEYSPSRIKKIATDNGADIILVHLECDGATHIDRCIERQKSGARHKGHCDLVVRDPELTAFRGPMDLGGRVILLNTDDFESSGFASVEEEIGGLII